MRQFVLPKPQFIAFAGNKLTDHNRQPVTVTYDQIESPQRMANGLMRKYFVATKRNWNFSWTNVPGTLANTVDGFWGAKDIETFYLANPQSFTLTLNYVTGTLTFQAFFSSFEKDLHSRYKDDYYDLTIGLVEA